MTKKKTKESYIQWTPKKLKLIQGMLDNGTSSKIIGEVFGVSVGRINQIIQQNGLNRGRKRSVKWHGEKLKELNEMLADSTLTLQAIGDHFGVTKQRIGQLAKEARESGGVYVPTYKVSKDYSVEEWRVVKLISAAKSRDSTLTITIEDLLPVPTHCPVFKTPLDYSSKKQGGRTEHSPSLDRVDSSKGYEKGNVAVISWRANRIKNNGTLEEHKQIVAFMENWL